MLFCFILSWKCGKKNIISLFNLPAGAPLFNTRVVGRCKFYNSSNMFYNRTSNNKISKSTFIELFLFKYYYNYVFIKYQYVLLHKKLKLYLPLVFIKKVINYSELSSSLLEHFSQIIIFFECILHTNLIHLVHFIDV